MALIASGAVAIEKGKNTRPIRLATLGAGEAVGEGLLLDDSIHGTSARALVKTQAYILTHEQVQDMLKETPTLYAALVGRAARAIKQRLSAVDATLAKYLSYEPGCTEANGWCDAPERQQTLRNTIAWST